MKKLSILFFIISLCACTAKESDFSLVRCNVIDEGVNVVNLYQVKEGITEPIATSNVINGVAAFQVAVPYKGLYSLGDGKKFDYMLYLEGGEDMELNIGKNQDIQPVGELTAENTVLAKWQSIISEVKHKSVYFMFGRSDFEDFFPQFESVSQIAEQFRGSINTSNRDFNELMGKVTDMQLRYIALQFLYTPRTKHPTKEQRIPYYKNVFKKELFNDDVVLKVPFGKRFTSVCLMHQTGESGINTLELISEVIEDKTVKGEMLVDYALRFKDYVLFQDFMADNKEIFNKSQQTRLDDIGAKLYAKMDSKIAANFTYPDLNGKNHSLTDYKGKVVVVDVWATWCGPCRQQIPALKKLEEEMHGQDVVFMGVSLDEQKNYDKWKQMVSDEGLKGVQLFANGWSKIAKDYAITGIPRFMVFGKDGNVISSDAPRPSQPELKKLIKKALAQK